MYYAVAKRHAFADLRIKMRKIIIALAIATIASPALAASSACVGIKQEKKRLACYDKDAAESEKMQSAAPQPVVPGPVPAQKLPEGVVFKSAAWHVNQKLDAMTDKRNCTALYKNAWVVQGTPRALYVSFRGRGGVKSYRVRIDDSAPESTQLATEMEKSISAIDLQPSFDRVYNSKRVRLEVLTVLGSVLVEDIDMAGFKDAVDYIRTSCEA